MNRLIKGFSFILGISFLTGCIDDSSALSPSLTPEIQKALNDAIEDEYKAQVTYRRILNDFGSQTKPFSNILNAEIKHADALANLLNNYHLPIPSIPWICRLSILSRMPVRQGLVQKLKTLRCTILF